MSRSAAFQHHRVTRLLRCTYLGGSIARHAASRQGRACCVLLVFLISTLLVFSVRCAIPRVLPAARAALVQQGAAARIPQQAQMHRPAAGPVPSSDGGIPPRITSPHGSRPLTDQSHGSDVPVLSHARLR